MRSLKVFLYPLVLIFVCNNILAQTKPGIIAGPMLTQVELRTAKIWIEVNPGTPIELWYWKKGNKTSARKITLAEKTQWFSPLLFDVVGLDINTTYEYQFITWNKGTKQPTQADGCFTTKDLWQWRKPVPDFSFLTGSCTYVNEPEYDRPGKLYGSDSSIFETMAQTPAAFMLWLGDNWYTREVDYFSEWGLWYRASHDRRLPVLQKFWKAMPHYAIWDDHDYGPNDGDKSYILKETSRKVFMNYWGNPSYGENGQGVYSKISHADADFFLMDDRYFRSADDMEAFIDGKPNPNKRMWGVQQIEWLKNALINSKASFKFIVTGSQTLNKVSPFDRLQNYPLEFNDLMSFLQEEKINGVVFLTGDRHHSEIIKYERPGAYTLYDITSSPLTSGVAKVNGNEKDNADRITGTLVEAQNFTRISISGKPKERVLKVEFLDIKGEKLSEWKLGENELAMPVQK